MQKRFIKGLAAACACVMVFGLSAFGTHSYLEAKDTKVNQFTSGSVETELTGDQNAAVRNIGNVPAYVRVRVLPVTDPEKFSFAFNTSDWEKDGTDTESWWYYKDILEPGEVTSDLFTNVTITGDLSGDDRDFVVYEESTQSEGYGNPKDAFK